MEKTYNEGLCMPKSYTILNEEEMCYTQGGFKFENHWWGFYLTLNHNECENISRVDFTVSLLGSLVAFPIALAISASSTIIGLFDKGKGVKLRYNYNPATTIINTGIWTV